MVRREHVQGGAVTRLERDILALLLAINTVFMVLILPNVVPIDYSNDGRGLLVTTLLWGIPLGALGVWMNHRFSHPNARASDPPRRK
jgi:hypothetical protein